MIAFSTNEAMRVDHNSEKLAKLTMSVVRIDDMTPIFMATIEATEEAIINSLFAAHDTPTYNGRVIKALPLDKVMEMMREHKKVAQ